MVHPNLFKTDARLAAKCVNDFALGYRQVTKTIYCLTVTFCLAYVLISA